MLGILGCPPDLHSTLLWSALSWGFLTRRDASTSSVGLWLPVGFDQWGAPVEDREEGEEWSQEYSSSRFPPCRLVVGGWTLKFSPTKLPFHFRIAINSSPYALQSPLSFLNTLHTPLWIKPLLNLTQIILILFLFPTERPWLEYFLSQNFVDFYCLISQDTMLWPFSYLAHAASPLVVPAHSSQADHHSSFTTPSSRSHLCLGPHYGLSFLPLHSIIYICEPQLLPQEHLNQYFPIKCEFSGLEIPSFPSSYNSGSHHSHNPTYNTGMI